MMKKEGRQIKIDMKLSSKARTWHFQEADNEDEDEDDSSNEGLKG